MKKLIFVIAASLFSIVCYCQTFDRCNSIAYKNHSDTSGNYLVKYSYNSCVFTTPLTYPPGEPHYQSEITVYKISKHLSDTVMIGKPFNGVYVKGGCFEDNVEQNVLKAKAD